MSKIELRVPTIGESINEVTLSRWLVEDGSYVEMDQSICEFESDKATLEFPAEASGIITYVAAEDDDLEIGGLVATLDTSAKAPVKDNAESTTEETSVKDEKETVSGEPIPSPAAAKILREKDVDPSEVKGSGKDGRITKGDAIKAEKKVEKPKIENPVIRVRQESFGRNERREKLSRMRRTIAKRLVSAKNTAAMLTTFNEVDLSAVMTLRKIHQEQFVDAYGIKLGFMSLFAKACAIALMEMPAVNSRLDEDHLIYQDFVDISVAISTPNGLVVPPIKNVESLRLHEIELAIKELAEKARNNTLSLEEMSGGTFTITNGGIFGSMMSTPILNEPQSAILGMHNIIQRPIAVNGNVEIRPMMYLAMSYDHRVIDGSTSVTFLVRVKELLEDPVKMMLFA